MLSLLLFLITLSDVQELRERYEALEARLQTVQEQLAAIQQQKAELAEKLGVSQRHMYPIKLARASCELQEQELFGDLHSGIPFGWASEQELRDLIAHKISSIEKEREEKNLQYNAAKSAGNTTRAAELERDLQHCKRRIERLQKISKGKIAEIDRVRQRWKDLSCLLKLCETDEPPLVSHVKRILAEMKSVKVELGIP